MAVAGGLGAAMHLAVTSGESDAIGTAWSITLYTLAFFALVVPLITGAGRSGFDPGKLLWFPISRGAIHRLALGSEFLSGSHLVWYPALLTTAIVGVLLPGPARLSRLTILGLYAIVLVVWSHTIALGVRRLLRGRRTRELAAVLGLALIVLLSMLPAAVDMASENVDERLEELFTIPTWVAGIATLFPPSMGCRALVGAQNGETGSAVGAVLSLGIWLVAGWVAGRVALNRLLAAGSGSGEVASVTRDSWFASARTRVLDHLPVTTGAVTAKELRYLFQSGTGKVSLLVMPVMTALPALLAGRHPGMQVIGIDLQLAVFVGVLIYGAALSGYLQMNAFAWENAGISSYFTSPVRLERVVLGKNLGVWVLNAVFAIEGLIVWSLVRGLPHASMVLTGLLIFASTTVLMSLLGNFTSIAVPVARPISSVSSTASPLGTLVMIGCLLVGITVAGLSVLGAGLLGAPSLAPVSAAGILAVAAVAYRLSLRPVTRLLSERREEVFRALGVG